MNEVLTDGDAPRAPKGPYTETGQGRNLYGAKHIAVVTSCIITRMTSIYSGSTAVRLPQLCICT